MPIILQLIETVEQLVVQHEQLLELEERKKQVLIDSNIEALQIITGEEAGFIQRMEKLEEKRVGLGEQLAVQSGIPLQELTASKLAEIEQNPERAAKINLLTGRFGKVIGQLKAANELNAELLKQSLDLVQHSIELMTAVPDAGTYSGKGAGQAAGTKRFFDSQA